MPLSTLRISWSFISSIYSMCVCMYVCMHVCMYIYNKYRFRHRFGTGTVLKVSIWHRYRKKANDTQPYWLYQILNYIIGRSSLRPFIIGLILNLQFHGGWLKLTRLNQIDFKTFYLLAQEKKGIIINLVRLWLTLLKSGKRLNVG